MRTKDWFLRSVQKGRKASLYRAKTRSYESRMVEQGKKSSDCSERWKEHWRIFCGLSFECTCTTMMRLSG